MKKFLKTILIFILLLNNSLVYGKTITPPDIVAYSAVVIDANSGIVIYNKNMDERLYPASITKIMTALLAIENSNDNYNQIVPISHEAVFSLPYGSSHIAMNEDETLTLNEALYGIMLASANEVSNAVAEHISGSVEEFGKLMTERAKELNLKNSNFINPHGLHDDKHYSTAFDMAQIMREAIKHPFFVKLINTQYFEIPPTEKQKEIRPLRNSNRLIIDGNLYYDENAVGSKTGYTNEARHTLVTYGKKDDMELIVAIMKGEKSVTYTDTSTLLEYGFEQYRELEVFNKESYSAKIPVEQKHNENTIALGEIDVVAEESALELLPQVVTLDKIKRDINLPDVIYSSVSKGDILGDISFVYEGNVIAKTNLTADNTINLLSEDELFEKGKYSFPAQTGNIMKAIFICLILFVVLLLALSIALIFNRRRFTKKRRSFRKIAKSYKYKNY